MVCQLVLGVLCHVSLKRCHAQEAVATHTSLSVFLGHISYNWVITSLLLQKGYSINVLCGGNFPITKPHRILSVIGHHDFCRPVKYYILDAPAFLKYLDELDDAIPYLSKLQELNECFNYHGAKYRSNP